MWQRAGSCGRLGSSGREGKPSAGDTTAQVGTGHTAAHPQFPRTSPASRSSPARAARR